MFSILLYIQIKQCSWFFRDQQSHMFTRAKGSSFMWYVCCAHVISNCSDKTRDYIYLILSWCLILVLISSCRKSHCRRGRVQAGGLYPDRRIPIVRQTGQRTFCHGRNWRSHRTHGAKITGAGTNWNMSFYTVPYDMIASLENCLKHKKCRCKDRLLSLSDVKGTVRCDKRTDQCNCHYNVIEREIIFKILEIRI